jgi:hypothetical protein
MITYHPLHVIHLTTSAKNEGETDNFCSVCSGCEIVFSLGESMVKKLAIYEWFFLLLWQVWSVVVYPPSFARESCLLGDSFCVQ